jgi:hypothetical protein
MSIIGGILKTLRRKGRLTGRHGGKQKPLRRNRVG